MLLLAGKWSFVVVGMLAKLRYKPLLRTCFTLPLASLKLSCVVPPSH